MTTDRVRTPDGRELEVVRHGPADAFPLVFHCGTPNAPAEFPQLFAAVDGKGWQLVALARPGYAGSTRQPDRSVADVAADVTAILDAYGLDRFAVLGWSGGGPHALACAALLRDRCTSAVSLAGVAPFDAGGLDFFAGMGPENVEEFGAAADDHEQLAALLTEFADDLRDISDEDIAASLGGLVDEVDRAALTGEFAAAMGRMLRHAVSTGTDGWFDDDLAFVKPWGFDLDAIRVPVSVWQGAHDMMVPFAHGQWLAAHIPGAKVHLYDDEGHLSLVQQLPRILDSLSDR
jgi:pimeloyl-ACP methyl ester carboxylesterase